MADFDYIRSISESLDDIDFDNISDDSSSDEFGYNVLLEVSDNTESDWNHRVKYYEMYVDILREFASKIKSKGLKDAWDWLMPQVDYYGDNPEKPVKRVCFQDDLDWYFLDWENPIECVKEWEL